MLIPNYGTCIELIEGSDVFQTGATIHRPITTQGKKYYKTYSNNNDGNTMKERTNTEWCKNTNISRTTATEAKL